jgi:hypothetical protein
VVDHPRISIIKEEEEIGVGEDGNVHKLEPIFFFKRLVASCHSFLFIIYHKASIHTIFINITRREPPLERIFDQKENGFNCLLCILLGNGKNENYLTILSL